MPTDIKALWKEGLSAYSNKDYEEAISIFSDVINLRNSSNAYFNRALAYYHSGELELARRDLSYIYEKGFIKLSILKLFKVIAIDQQDEEDVKYWDKCIEEFKEKELKTQQGGGEIKEGRVTSVDSDGVLKTIALFKPNITFKDVIGMPKIKKYLYRHVINAIQNPELYKEYDKKLGGGVIIYGSSGIGKTYLARATAGEAGANMIVIKPSEILSQYVSVGEKNIANLWAFARKRTPCILFLDEVDSIAGKRHSNIEDTKGTGSALRTLINAILIEMSSVDANNEGIIVIAATNKPYDIDPALKRSGRFDDSIYCRPPNLPERVEMFKYYLKDKPISKISYLRCGLATAGYSGADISRIVDISLLEPIDEAIRTKNRRKLTMKDILNTINKDLNESPLYEWFFNTKAEILGKEQIEIINGKVHKSFKSGILEAGEKETFEELIKDTIRYTSSIGRFKIKTQRWMGHNLPI